MRFLVRPVLVGLPIAPGGDCDATNNGTPGDAGVESAPSPSYTHDESDAPRFGCVPAGQEPESADEICSGGNRCVGARAARVCISRSGAPLAEFGIDTWGCGADTRVSTHGKFVVGDVVRGAAVRQVLPTLLDCFPPDLRGV